MAGILQAPTGTRLYDRLKSEGYVLGNMSGDTDGTTNISPRMDLNSLRGGYHRITNQTYSIKHYFEHIKSFLREYKYPKAKILLGFQRIMAFFRSNIRLGVFGRERFQYWKVVAWTLSRRPSLLPLAITLAIYGHHFRKVCRVHISNSHKEAAPLAAGLVGLVSFFVSTFLERSY